jgi:hypothetical protein
MTKTVISNDKNYGKGYIERIFLSANRKYVLDFRYKGAKDPINLMLVKFENQSLLIMCSYFPLKTVHKKNQNVKLKNKS